MQYLSIDIETYSSVNLQKAGVYKYAESPDFEILLFGYSVDGGAVHVIDLACGEKIPAEIVDALSDESVIKWAFNAQFERVCLSNYLDTWLSPDSWHCTMVWSATLGLPLSLEGVGAVLGLPMEKWDKCSFVVSEDDLEGRVCYGGLDLSSTTDITAFVLVFPPLDEEDKFCILPYFWIPEETLELRVRRDHVPYDVWKRQGYLQTTEGNVVHYGYIERFIEKLGERFNIREIAFDRWGAVQMVQNLEGMGFTVVPFGQGFKDMSPPTKELMKLTLEQKLAHGGHPVLRWMMDNIYIRTDPAGNIKADKEKSTEKIDGAVATIMALDRAIRCGNQVTESVYDHRGILFI